MDSQMDRFYRGKEEIEDAKAQGIRLDKEGVDRETGEPPAPRLGRITRQQVRDRTRRLEAIRSNIVKGRYHRQKLQAKASRGQMPGGKKKGVLPK